MILFLFAALAADPALCNTFLSDEPQYMTTVRDTDTVYHVFHQSVNYNLKGDIDEILILTTFDKRVKEVAYKLESSEQANKIIKYISKQETKRKWTLDGETYQVGFLQGFLVLRKQCSVF